MAIGQIEQGKDGGRCCTARELMPRNLTSRQQQVVDHIADIHANFGRAPTMQQLADRMRCSRQNIAQICEKLRDMGEVELGPGYRNLRLRGMDNEKEL